MRLLPFLFFILFATQSKAQSQDKIDSTLVSYTIETVTKDSFWLSQNIQVFKNGLKKPSLSSDPIFMFHNLDELSTYIFNVRKQAQEYRNAAGILDYRAIQIEQISKPLKK